MGEQNRHGHAGIYDRPRQRPPAMAVAAGLAAAALAALAVAMWLV